MVCCAGGISDCPSCCPRGADSELLRRRKHSRQPSGGVQVPRMRVRRLRLRLRLRQQQAARAQQARAARPRAQPRRALLCVVPRPSRRLLQSQSQSIPPCQMVGPCTCCRWLLCCNCIVGVLLICQVSASTTVRNRRISTHSTCATPSPCHHSHSTPRCTLMHCRPSPSR
jgi:hypothetical protein